MNRNFSKRPMKWLIVTMDFAIKLRGRKDIQEEDIPEEVPVEGKSRILDGRE